MATCRDIITLGLKQARIIRVSADPKAAEADVGLMVLQSLYESWFSLGEFGFLHEIYKEDDHTALEQERVTAATGVTVTLPTTYASDSEEYRSGTGSRRAPRELAAIEVVQDGVVTPYIWERAAWVPLSSLTLASDAPLSHYGQAGLAACFAMHYAETFGGQIGPGTKALSDKFMTAVRVRRNSAQPGAAGEFM